MKIYLAKSLSLNFRYPFDSRGCLNSGWEIFYVCISRDFCLRRTANVIKPNRFCYYVQKGFRENLVRVIVSTFVIFMFVGQLLLVDVFLSCTI